MQKNKPVIIMLVLTLLILSTIMILTILGKIGVGPAAISNTNEPLHATITYEPSTTTVPETTQEPTAMPVATVEEPYHYDNHQTAAYVLANDAKLQLGINEPDADDALYLSPMIIPGTGDNSKYMLFITSSNGNLEYAQTQGAAPEQYSDSTFIVTGQTYDTCIPAQYQNREYYGIRYHIKLDAESGQLASMLSIRVVRVDDGDLCGIIHVPIEYNPATETFTLGECVNGDVRATGEMDEKECKRITQNVALYLRNIHTGPLLNIQDDMIWVKGRDRVMIEHVPRTYFDKFIAKENSCVYQWDEFANAEIYAVNMPLAGHGFYTVYCMPQATILGARANNLLPDAAKTIEIAGYDAINPYSHDTLFVPSQLEEQFYSGGQ